MTKPAIPEDTFELRLQIARVHAGVRRGLSRGLTASEAGHLVGVAGQTWRSWETGATTNAARRPAMLDKIAKELGVPLEWLEHGGPLERPKD
jgi:transcriptional regulator with XRE-family HTH domain